MTAAARDAFPSLRGCGCAGYQGMLTSAAILITNPEDLEVKNLSFRFLVFSFQQEQTPRLKTEN
jgi:hypothetical protein